MKTRNELIENSKIYFNNKEVNLIYATSDGQFFHENSYQALDNYVKGKNISFETITRIDLNPIKIEEPVIKIEKPKKEDKKEEVKIVKNNKIKK